MHEQPHIDKLLQDRYYLRDEEGNLLEHDPNQMYDRVAYAVSRAEKYDDQDYFHEVFYKLMADNKFLPNTPTLINAGKEKPGCFSACFKLPIEDSMEGIFETLKNSALVFKAGGGVGYNFSNLREEGAIVKSTGHKASGPLSFMRAFDTMCDTVAQGGARRGAMIAILNCDHPDIEKFIEMKDDGVSFSNFNMSVGITDAFMACVEDNMMWELISPSTKEVVKKVPAKELWDKIVEHAHKTGDPGLFFLDTYNKSNVLQGEWNKITGCNPCGELGLRDNESCISKGELVLTSSGFVAIEDIGAGDYVASIKDGKTIYAEVSAVKNNGTHPIYTVLTKEGYKVKATEDHRFLTVDGWKEVKDLALDDELILGANYFLPEHEEQHLEWELLGWMHGDGWFTENSVGISFNYNDGDWEAKDRLLPIYEELVLGGKERKPLRNDGVSYQVQTENSSAYEFLSKYGVSLATASDRVLPATIWTATLEEQRAFLKGYITADGGIIGEANSQYKIASSNRRMLEQVQLLLTRFGIGCWISTNNMDNYSNRKPQSQLVITGEDAKTLATTIGFLSQKKEDKFNCNPPRKYGKRETVKVLSIEYAGEEEVFDIEVPYTRNFIVNGLVAHNCNLGSINLMAYIKDDPNIAYKCYEFNWDKLEEDIPTMVRFLDDVIDVNPFPLPEIDRASKDSRRIGLGIMGWADCLIKMGIPYDSQAAVNLAEELIAFIYNIADRASRELATEKGKFPLWAQCKPILQRRNLTLLTIAPTGTISRIAGVSSGIEPIFAWKIHHKLVDLTYDEIHPAYKELMEED